MNRYCCTGLLLKFFLFFITGTGVAQPFSNTQNPTTTIPRLFMNMPAQHWNEAMPIGNGRLGAMVYGGVEEERIQTNEDSFWSGEPRNVQNPEAAKYLLQVRQLLNEGKHREAEDIINTKLLGPNNECYLPLADILLRFHCKGEIHHYKRELDLSKALLHISYEQGGVHFTREIFASYPAQAIIMRIKSDQPKAIHCSIGLTSLVHYSAHTENHQVIIHGQAPLHAYPSYEGKKAPVYAEGKGMRFEGRIFVQHTNGSILDDDSTITVTGASELTLVFVAATSFNGFDKDPFSEGKDEQLYCRRYAYQVKKQSYQQLLADHIKDYTSLFNRVQIDLGNSSLASLPINDRISNYQPHTDPALTALYFQFGRYLLISSSRKGSQPANLQGLWSNSLQPAWSANWTINCNTQINYWPAEITNLSECHWPLFQLIKETMVDGMKTAQNLYHSKGWVAHHNIDLWRTTWPVGGSGRWAFFQVGSAWLCEHIWEHFLFTNDTSFLASHYYILKSAAQFYTDNLQKNADGFYVTNPSVSFENEYVSNKGETGWATVGAMEDIQIIRSLFSHVIAAAALLHDDDTLVEQVRMKTEHLLPLKISAATGQLQEWEDDLYPAHPSNGQLPQGWGLIPGHLISLRKTPELALALRKTIEARNLSRSDNSGSWIGAFAANYWARLHEGDSVQEVIDRHFRLALYPNFTCQFHKVFQVDGTLGITAAIAEMLVQSQDGEIELLPALPSSYQNGFVKGLKARGNDEVSVYWKKGRLQKAILHSFSGGDRVVRYKEKTITINLKKGATITLNDALQVIK